jgi:thioesterase domain-containing protein
MARQLVARGERIAELVLLDTSAPGFALLAARVNPTDAPARLSFAERLGDELRTLREYGWKSLAERTHFKLFNLLLRGWRLDLLALVRPTRARSRKAEVAWLRAAKQYVGGNYDAPVSLVLSRPRTVRNMRIVSQYPWLGWDMLIDQSKITKIVFDCSHLEMVTGSYGRELAAFIEARIDVALKAR